MTEKRAARHRCNDDRAKNVHARTTTLYHDDYELGTLLFGLMFALAVGVCMLLEVVL